MDEVSFASGLILGLIFGMVLGVRLLLEHQQSKVYND